MGLWAPVALFMVLVYVLASPQMLPDAALRWHSVIHVAAYAGFALLCLRAFHGGFAGFLRPRQTVLAVALALVYAFLDEWNQTRIAGRSASVEDWLADAAGVGLALLIAGGILAVVRRPAEDAVHGTSESSEGGG